MMTKQAFIRALERDVPLILDGGLATQLEAQGCDIGNALWSASLLQSDPEAIVEAMHRDGELPGKSRGLRERRPVG